MKKIYFLSLFFLLALFLHGCYESAVPLSETPSLQVDGRLIRNWTSITHDKTEAAISLSILKFNDNEYLVTWKDGDDNETVLARGFTTRVGNTNIMNLQGVQSLEATERTYVFFKFDINQDGNLVVCILSNDFDELHDRKFESSREFNDFVRKNIGSSGLFDEDIEFRPTGEFRFELN